MAIFPQQSCNQEGTIDANRDIYHEIVKQALIKDGWVITDDPLHLKWGAKDLYIDLGAENLIAAEKATQKIAVEVKSFTGPSEMRDLEQAIGQYVIYEDVLRQVQPERVLYLAIPEEVHYDLFEEPIGQLLRSTRHVRLVIFDPERGVLLQWNA
jgi:hypothetical protein